MVGGQHSILPLGLGIEDRTGARYSVRPATPPLVQAHLSEIEDLHQSIPHTRTRFQDLFHSATSSDGAPYRMRNQLSFLLFDKSRCIGMAISYFREAPHALIESVYLHRLAIHGDFRRRGLGTALLKLSINTYLNQLPWLLTITAQTNFESANEGVMSFYHQLGFRRVGTVAYPDKTDILMEMTRDYWEACDWRVRQSMGPATADICRSLGKPVEGAPFIFFGSTSEAKTAQYEFLLRSVGLRIRSALPVVPLTEPQVEGSGPGPESELVSAPLKGFARFAKLRGSFPLLIEDTMLFIERFNREWPIGAMLPGPDTKRWWQALGIEGLLDLMGETTKRRARYVCQIGVSLGPGDYRFFRSDLDGTIAKEPGLGANAEPFPYSNSTFFHRVFVADGHSVPLSDLPAIEFQSVDYRRSCLLKALETLRANAGPADEQLEIHQGE